MKKFLTTIELIDVELERLGFEKCPDWTETYPIRKNNVFRARIREHDSSYNILELGVNECFDRWSNSCNFQLMLCNRHETDLCKAIVAASFIVELKLYDFNTFFYPIPLQG